MKQLYSKILIFLLIISSGGLLKAQSFFETGEIHGSVQLDGQYYLEDGGIGIKDLKGKSFGINGYTNLIYTKGKFSAGLRYEAYLPPLNGFENKYEGQGIPYRWAQFSDELIDITVGNFYEQFGSGLLLRTYQEWNLGIDNSLDGGRVILRPMKGVTLKGVYGVQRNFWVKYENKNRGIVRGIDGEFSLNDLICSLYKSPANITLGGSFVSKYQQVTSSTYKQPENVGAIAGRANISWGILNWFGEYAWKANDPSAINNNIYKNGEALYTSLSLAKKGFSFFFQGKRLDNMSFKSDRTATGSALDMNFLPPVNRQNTYALAAMFPYATQPNGEIGFSAQVSYKIPKKSALGGKYGTTLTVGYEQVNAIKKEAIDGAIDKAYTDGYTSPFFSFGEQNYYNQTYFEMIKKWTKKFKTTLTYQYIENEIAITEKHTGYPKVYQHVGVLDMTFRLPKRRSLHLELSYSNSNQHELPEDANEENTDASVQGRLGSWAGVLAEYNVGNWFFAAIDQYNFNNEVKDFRDHYYNFSFGYTKKATRISLGYGRQREGLLCVGGVCRQVPASSGLSLTIATSF